MTSSFDRFGGPNQRFAPASRTQLTGAGFFRGQMPISPTRSSFLFSSRPAAANPRLATTANRPFFQHQQFRQAPGNFGTQHGVAPNLQNRSSMPGYAPSPQPSNGWQRFGDPGNRTGFRQGSEPSGWHRFGQPQPSSPSTNSGRPGGQTYTPGNNPRPYSSRPPATNAPAPQRQNFPGYGGPAHYNEPAPHYSAPTPHYSTPQAPRNESHGGGSSFHGGGGGGSNRGGGGGHSSGGGHRGR